MTKKTLIAITAVVLVLFCTVGATLAWLVANTSEVTNKFTYGDINIELWEHKLVNGSLSTTEKTTIGNQDYKMIPGSDLPKDPTVTVKEGSEACYLFVVVTKSANFDTFFSAYTIDTGWAQLKDADNNDVPGVYYREVSATNADVDYNILKDKKVSVKGTVTKGDFSGITIEEDGATKKDSPTLTFKAYAVQQANVASAAAAWAIANPTT